MKGKTENILVISLFFFYLVTNEGASELVVFAIHQLSIQKVLQKCKIHKIVVSDTR